MMKRKIISLLCVLTLVFTSFSPMIPAHASTADENSVIIPESEIPLKLWYDEEAPKINEQFSHPDYDQYDDEDQGWQQWSLPLGNGYTGVSVFGRTETERIQITDHTLVSRYQKIAGSEKNISYGGVNNFSETFIDFGHKNVSNYKRYLDIETAISGVEYTLDGVKYSREYFTSYPDKALVIRLDADTNGALSFTLRPTIPYEQSYMAVPGDGYGKTGTVESYKEGNVGCIELAGKLEYFDVDFFGKYKVYADGGTVTASTTNHTYKDTDGTEITDIDGTIVVEDANSAYIVVTLGTDYELVSENFTADDKKKPTFNTDIDDAKAKVEANMSAIDAKITGKTFDAAYNTLKDSHVADYSELFGRVDVNLGCNEADLSVTTDALLEDYKEGYKSTYLEVLLFQYGRYLLISSSRSGALPGNLQGVWNPYNNAPWGAGYWHNLNIQMNYWPAFSTNLAETFESYVEYNQAYMAKAKQLANTSVKNNYSAVNGKDGGNGWVLGTSTFPFRLSTDQNPGNLGFTTQMFWDYYAYTKDPEVLELVYDILVDAARYITKRVVQDEDGNYLIHNVDSPESYVNGVWYYTNGTTYAQSFAYLNNYHVLEMAKELGIDLTDKELLSEEEYSVLNTIMEQIDKYDPINVGLSGQIKEFREETYYASMNDDPKHRHTSQLVGLWPGNIINSNTPAWIDASLVTLEGREGNTSGNWVYSWKTGLYARAKEGDQARKKVDELLTKETFPNLFTRLWDIYQIEASLGVTAGIAEMLLQSNAGYIEPLAALPTNWANGSYTGLCAEGNFEVSAAWENGTAKTFNILSKSGEKVSVAYPSITDAKVVRASDGETIAYTIDASNRISFDTEIGETYIISGFEAQEKIDSPESLEIQRDGEFGKFTFNWETVADAESYNVYRALENSDTYTLIGNTESNSFSFTPEKENENARTTFAVTAVSASGIESKRTLVYSNPVEGAISTEYGAIPSASVTDDTNFAIFVKEEGASEYKLMTVGPRFIEEGIDLARLYLKKGSGTYQGGTVVVYCLKDYTHATGKGWNSAFQVNGTIIVDLGGNTFTSTDPRIIGFEAKSSESGLGYDCTSTFEFKNGTLVTSKPIVEVFGSSGVYTGTKVCNLIFDGITFTPKGSAFTLFNARGSYTTTQKAAFNVELTDCTLNYSSLTGVVLLNDSCTAGTVDSSLTVKGGTINVNNFSDITLTQGFASEDTLMFAKTDEGNFTTLTMSKGASTPTATFNNGELKFVKTSENANTSSFVLTHTKFTSYTPKTSITLSNALIYNVYVPKTESLKSFTLDGVSYTDFSAISDKVKTLSDGEQYYHFKIELPASEAARNILLKVTLNVGGTDYNGSWTMSIPKYAEKLISNGNEVEVQLVKDVLAYIRAAYAFFDRSDEVAMSKIDALLGENYDVNNAPLLDGSAEAPKTGLNGVTFVLSATPAIRFYVSSTTDKYEFFVDGEKLDTKEGTDATGAYIEMDVYAYAMCETITYTINGVESGNYHINSYYTFVTTDENYKNNTELTNLVARFAKYCESAKAYRDYVLSNDSQN